MSDILLNYRQPIEPIPQTYFNGSTPYYADKARPELIAPVTISSANGVSKPVLNASSEVNGPYTGALNISPSESSLGPACDGLTIAAGADGARVEVGTDSQAVNTLSIAGPQGLSRVYDELYNPAVSLKPITMVSVNPLCAPAPDNDGEIFRCSQAGVLSSATAAIANTISVPVTGWYSLQIEVKLENAVAPAAPDINVPITPVGTIDIGETLTLVFTQGVVVQPYGAQECVSSEFLASSIVQQGGNVIRQYVSQHLFTEGVVYGFSLRSSSALWNIGTNGQIKAELIAMC
jgi:hypothetical protein